MRKKFVTLLFSLIGFISLSGAVNAGIKLPEQFLEAGSDTTNLSKYTDEQLMSVKNFVVEVPKFGKITFLKPLNLSGAGVKTMMANLDDYLEFGQGTINFDATEFPQLTKPVLVQLYNVKLGEKEELQVIEAGKLAADQDSFNMEYDKDSEIAKFTAAKLGDYKLEIATDEPGIKTQTIQYLILQSNFAPVMISVTGITFIVLGLLLWLNSSRSGREALTRSAIKNPGVTAGVAAAVTGVFVMATFAASPLLSVQRTTSTQDVSVASDEIVGKGGPNAAYCAKPSTSRCQFSKGRFTGYRCVSVLVSTNSCSSGWALNCTQVDKSCSQYNATRPIVNITPKGLTNTITNVYRNTVKPIVINNLAD